MSDEELRDKGHPAEGYQTTIVDGDPAVELPNGDTLVFRTQVHITDATHPLGRRPLETRAERDYDAANDVAWFQVFSDERESDPHLTIEPAVVDE